MRPFLFDKKMRKLTLLLMLICGAMPLQAQEQDPVVLFKYWCDAFSAKSMIALSANRMFGRILDLSDEEYEVRAKWTNEATDIIEHRFEQLSGYPYQIFHAQVAYPNGLVSMCQLKDVID